MTELDKHRTKHCLDFTNHGGACMRSQVVRAAGSSIDDEWRISIVGADTWLGCRRVQHLEKRVRLLTWSDPGLVALAAVCLFNVIYASVRRVRIQPNANGYRVIVKEYWPLQFAANWPAPTHRSAPMTKKEAEVLQRRVSEAVKTQGVDAISSVL